MGDLRDKKVRQKFLQDSINREMLIRKLRKLQDEVREQALHSEAKLINQMANYLENDSTEDYKALRKRFKLRTLHLI